MSHPFISGQVELLFSQSWYFCFKWICEVSSIKPYKNNFLVAWFDENFFLSIYITIDYL